MCQYTFQITVDKNMWLFSLILAANEKNKGVYHFIGNAILKALFTFFLSVKTSTYNPMPDYNIWCSLILIANQGWDHALLSQVFLLVELFIGKLAVKV